MAFQSLFRARAVVALVMRDHGVTGVGRSRCHAVHRRSHRLLRNVWCAISRRLQPAGFFFRLLPLVVMPLDGVEHAGAKHEHLEGDENYRDPIHF